jgi:hypothetical protein
VPSADVDWPEPTRPGGRSGTAAGTVAGGGEPVDEPVGELTSEPVDEPTGGRSPVQTGEPQALELLRRTLGAEKIGEVAP